MPAVAAMDARLQTASVQKDSDGKALAESCRGKTQVSELQGAGAVGEAVVGWRRGTTQDVHLSLCTNLCAGCGYFC